MNRKIKSLEIIGIVEDKLNANHDVIVELTDSQKYVATFFTLSNIQHLMEYYEQYTGECNNGNFFWASDMCIIKEIDEKMLTEAITSMIEKDFFDRVFHLMKPFDDSPD